MLYAWFGQFRPNDQPRETHRMAGITAPVDMLAKVLTEIAREVSQMDPDDPVGAERLKELCELTELT